MFQATRKVKNALGRVKVIKDLVLQKLDTTTHKVEDLNYTANALLQASSYLVETAQTSQPLQTQILESQQANQQVNQPLLEETVVTTHALLQASTYLVECQQQFAQSQQQLAQSQQTATQLLMQMDVLVQELHRRNPREVIRVNPDLTDTWALENPEAALMAYLYSFLPDRTAIDVGANIGDFSCALLQAGYEVFAFEPFMPVYDQMKDRLGQRKSFHAFPLALGSASETKDLYIATDQSSNQLYGRGDLFSTLVKHSMPEDLVFTDQVSVPVQTLQEMHETAMLPNKVSLVKIDTEGHDLEVIRGMGDQRYPVVVTEFWDHKIPFAQSGVDYTLETLVSEMRSRGYYWHLVIYRVWGDAETIRFYCNSPKSVDRSWGNVFFFQDWKVFEAALHWCSAALPTAYFT
jgi:FkbM family methyltransferase